MTIPYEFNPLGQNNFVPPPDPGVQYEDIVEGNYSGSTPLPSMLRYGLYYDCDFPERGTLQVTHVILGKFVALHEGLYIGWNGLDVGSDYQFKREELNWLAEEPSPVAGELTNVVCSLLGGTLDPVEIGPGMGTYSQDLPLNIKTAWARPAEFQKIMVNGEERFVYANVCSSQNMTKGYMNPLGASTGKTTTAPDGKLHVQMKATKYTGVDAFFGLRYLIRLK